MDKIRLWGKAQKVIGVFFVNFTEPEQFENDLYPAVVVSGKVPGSFDVFWLNGHSAKGVTRDVINIGDSIR